MAAEPPQDIRLPSAFCNADGRPRFTMPIPRAALKDAGIGFLFRHEREFFGYEYPTRRFIDEHLAPGDLFIDIGAHWGVFSLTAATRWPGHTEPAVDVLAIEPAPDNITQLLRWIGFNRLEQQIRVVPAAAGARAGQAVFKRDSTMGHRVVGDGQEGENGFTADQAFFLRHKGDDKMVWSIHLTGITGRSQILRDFEGRERRLPQVNEGAF